MKDHPSQWIASGLTCRDVAVNASDYGEDWLPVFTKVRIGIHLAACADCRAYAGQMALVRETLGRLPKIYPRAINRLHLRQHFAACHRTPRP